MAVDVKHDGSKPGEVQENCCKCGLPTRYWYGTGVSNVALCRACADMYEVGDLPTKAEWVAGERAKRERPFWTTR